MIEHPHVDQRQGAFQGLGEELVGVARLGDAAGVVVGEDDRGGIVVQGALDDFAGVHAGLGEGAAKQFFAGDDAVLRVEKETEENFMAQAGEVQAQIVAHQFRRDQSVAFGDFLAQGAARHFQDSLELREFSFSHSRHGTEILARGGKQAGQAAEALDEFARQIDGAFTGEAGAQENRQQFGIGKCRRTLLQQAFAGAFIDGPIGDGHDVSVC